MNPGTTHLNRSTNAPENEEGKRKTDTPRRITITLVESNRTLSGSMSSQQMMISDSDRLIWRVEPPPEGRDETPEEKAVRSLSFDYIGWEGTGVWASPWATVTQVKLSESLGDIVRMIGKKATEDVANIIVDFISPIQAYDYLHNNNRDPIHVILKLDRNVKEFIPYEFPPSRNLGRRLRNSSSREWKDKIKLTKNGVLMLRIGALKNKDSVRTFSANIESELTALGRNADVYNTCEYDKDEGPWGKERCKKCDGNFVENSLFLLREMRDRAAYFRPREPEDSDYYRYQGPIEKRMIKGVLEGEFKGYRVLFNLWNEAREQGYDLMNEDADIPNTKFDYCTVE